VKEKIYKVFTGRKYTNN